MRLLPISAARLGVHHPAPVFYEQLAIFPGVDASNLPHSRKCNKQEARCKQLGKYDEAHLSAQQTCSQTPSRLSFTHGDSRGTPGYCPPPHPRAQEAFCLRLVISTGFNSQASAMDDRIAVNLERLKKRRDFLAVKKGMRAHGRCFTLQARKRETAQIHQKTAAPDNVARFGITVTKKVGNAVVRNRIRRRLREAIRLNGAPHAQAGKDYVLIARETALGAPFLGLVDELLTGLGRVARKKPLKKQDNYPISRPSALSNTAKQLESGRRDDMSAPSTGSKFHGK